MSMLACICGEVILDNTDHLSYKGYVFADTEFFDLFDRISADIAGFIQARLAGTDRQWISAYFRKDIPLGDEELVQTIISRCLIHACMDIYQCPKCGRVHVARRDGSRIFERFTPDTAPHRDIFQK